METKDSYKLGYDASLLALSVLQRLDTGSVVSFEDRLKSQKVQYLAQVFGISPQYRFNLYVRGPYSPDLASDLYLFKQHKDAIDTHGFIPEELEERFSKLKKFIENKSVRELELIATLHWLMKVATLDVNAAKKKLTDWKNATEDELKSSFAELETI